MNQNDRDVERLENLREGIEGAQRGEFPNGEHVPEIPSKISIAKHNDLIYQFFGLVLLALIATISLQFLLEKPFDWLFRILIPLPW